MSRSAVVVSGLLAVGAAWPFLQPGATCAAAISSDGIQPLESEYIVDFWQTEQGLPDNSVNAITQTPDGYLWIATFNGLARFNGVEFVVFDSANTPELPSSRITDLKLDRRGRLWIRSEEGDVTQCSDGRFKAFGEREGLTNSILVVWEDHAGGIWASPSNSATNYFHFADAVFENAHSRNTFYHRFGKGTDIHGYGYGIRSNNLFSVRPQDPTDVPIPGFRAPQGSRITASRDGAVWLIAHRIMKFYPRTASADAHWEDYGPLPHPTDQFGGFLEDRLGNLWVGTAARQIWRIGSNHVATRFTFANNATAELGKSMFEDAEGNLWIGNRGSGLARLKPHALKTYDSRDGLKSDLVRAVTQDRNANTWLLTVNGVDWFPSGNARAQPSGLTISLPWTIHATRDGTIWIGTFGKGLFRYQPEYGTNGTWFHMAGRTGSSPLNVIFEDHSGHLYLGTHRGLYHIDDDALIQCDQPDGPMDVRAIAEDSRGQLYVGLNGEGLLRKTGAVWRQFTAQNGLSVRHVVSLYVDQDDTVWIGAQGGGLTRFKQGQFFNFRGIELPRIITAIIQDDTGHLWFGSNQGLYRAKRAQLNQLGDGRISTADVTHYDHADGMGSTSQCTGDPCKTPDGRLWFPTMGGVTVVDPRSLPHNTRPPPVVVEAVSIDDKPLAHSTSRLTVPVGTHRLEFRYAGLSFTAPERVRFQYRLQGFDHAWVNVGTRRTAYYTKVPPGTYRFQVIAANNDNVWSSTAASVRVVVLPHFWQTNWFLFAMVIGAAAVVLAAYKLRMVQLEGQRLVQESFSRRLIESQENERKRIAAELHDSLGQTLLVIKNYAHMAAKETTPHAKMREQVREISENSSAAIEEVRSIARDLRPYQLDRFGLTKTLEDAADVLAKAGNLQIETQIDNVDEAFSPSAQISIYRVVQEWLNNVLKHARASTARLIVRKESRLVRINLQDDGVGFNYDAVMNRSGPAASFGLANLRERIRLLGGTLKVETAPGKGTRLTVEIPCLP